MKFIRQDGHKQKRLGTKWRKPKGYQSKMRLQKKGYHAVVKVGYGRKTEDKGKDKTGKILTVVSNLTELKKADSKIQSILISATIGKRKKLELFEEAKKLKIELSNVSDEKIKKIQKEMTERKEIKNKKIVKKIKKTETKKKEESKKETSSKTTVEKSKETSSEKTKPIEESKEKQVEEGKKEKREQEKILIKKQ